MARWCRFTDTDGICGFLLLCSKWLTDIYKTADLYTDKTAVEAWNKEISSSQESREAVVRDNCISCCELGVRCGEMLALRTICRRV